MALNSIVEKDGDLSINSVRKPFDTNKDDYNLNSTRSLLTTTILKFMQSTFAENKSNVKIFTQHIIPYLSY